MSVRWNFGSSVVKIRKIVGIYAVRIAVLELNLAVIDQCVAVHC
jgi:hypothetical protein